MKKLTKLGLISTLAALTLPTAAHAKKGKRSTPVPTNYIAAAYMVSGDNEFDDGSSKQSFDLDKGFRIDAFYATDKQWGIYGHYENFKVEDGDDETNTYIDIGARYFHKYTKLTRLFAGVGYNKLDLEDDDDLKGYGVHVGATSQLSKEVNGWVKLEYQDLELGDADLSGIGTEVGGSYRYDKTYSLYAVYTNIDRDADKANAEINNNSISIGVIYSLH